MSEVDEALASIDRGKVASEEEAKAFFSNCMMKLICSDIALARIESIYDAVRADQPAAATRVVKRLKQAVEMVGKFPHSGRPLRRKCTFIAVLKTPHLIVYKYEPHAITMATVLHGSENWWKQFPLR